MRDRGSKCDCRRYDYCIQNGYLEWFSTCIGVGWLTISANSALSPRNWFSLSRLHYIITIYIHIYIYVYIYIDRYIYILKLFSHLVATGTRKQQWDSQDSHCGRESLHTSFEVARSIVSMKVSNPFFDSPQPIQKSKSNRTCPEHTRSANEYGSIPLQFCCRGTFHWIQNAEGSCLCVCMCFQVN